MKCLYHKRRTSENRYLYDKDVYNSLAVVCIDMS